MLNVDWNVALARLVFLEGYLVNMKKEIAMKNEKLFPRAQQAPEETRAAKAPLAPARRPDWPHHRRFWHRRVHAPAPQPPKPQAPTES